MNYDKICYNQSEGQILKEAGYSHREEDFFALSSRSSRAILAYSIYKFVTIGLAP